MKLKAVMLAPVSFSTWAQPAEMSPALPTSYRNVNEAHKAFF
jgi:hypothetical protein